MANCKGYSLCLRYAKPLAVLSFRNCRQADPCKVSSIVSSLRDSLQEGASIQAVVEKPVPGPLNGTFSIFGTGFAYGVWAGILAAHKIGIDTVLSTGTVKLLMGSPLNYVGSELDCNPTRIAF